MESGRARIYHGFRVGSESRRTPRLEALGKALVMWRRLVSFFRRHPVNIPELHPGPRVESSYERAASERERQRLRALREEFERRSLIVQAQVNVDAKRFE